MADSQNSSSATGTTAAVLESGGEVGSKSPSHTIERGGVLPNNISSKKRKIDAELSNNAARRIQNKVYWFIIMKMIYIDITSCHMQLALSNDNLIFI